MNPRLAPHRATARRRASWAIFWTLWIAGIGVAFMLAMDSGRSNLGLLALGGLVAIGVSALILHSILSPLRYDGTTASYAGRGLGTSAIGAAALHDGGGSTGGDGGGAGGGG